MKKLAMRNLKKKNTKEDMDVYNLEGAIKKVWGCEATLFVDISWSLLQRQKRIVIYYVKKFVRKSQ